jgi:hypothetical protein
MSEAVDDLLKALLPDNAQADEHASRLRAAAGDSERHCRSTGSKATSRRCSATFGGILCA